MATSSGNSSILQNSGSEGCDVVDVRKRKRMQSNRESARRSRKRKQQHLDELTAQVSQLRKENSQILTSISITTQNYLNVEAENCVLKAQLAELSHRLDSLTDILNYNNNIINNNNGMVVFDQPSHHEAMMMTGSTAAEQQNSSFMMNPWNNLLYSNLPSWPPQTCFRTNQCCIMGSTQ